MVDSPYYIQGTNCLKNKLGITDASTLSEVETKYSARKQSALEANPLPGPIDYSYLKQIHKVLFDDIYEWAGKERAFQTEKQGNRFEWPYNIEKNSQKLFSKLAEENHLKGLGRAEFIERAADYYCELNVIHPFPEGNGRAQRVVFDQIAMGAGYEFRWDLTTKENVIDAVIHGYTTDNSKLEVLFDQVLTELDLSLNQDKNSNIEFSIVNPVSVSEYRESVALVDKHRKAVESELFPRESAQKILDDVQKVKINRRVKSLVPAAVETKQIFEEHEKIASLFMQLKDNIIVGGKNTERAHVPLDKPHT